MAPIANHDASPPSPGTASGDGGRLSTAHLDDGRALAEQTAKADDCDRLTDNARGPDDLSGTRRPIGSGAVHPSFASAPGAGLPEFRALLFLVSWPLFVIAFTAAVVWIFL